MVANISHLKQPQHSPPNKEPANPHKYAWLFKTEPTRSAPAATIAVRSGINIPSPDDHSNSWESRAFAEDTSSFAAGIWPPRAYPCSFCRREFRSAQALGGHMNVHRRDRARLRHPSPPQGTFSTPITLPQHRSLFQAHDKCIGSPSVIYPNNSLIKLNSPAPISHSKYRDLPKTTPYASFTAGHCADNATSFPLRLQQLASEAAASLMYPQACDASDPHSVWPKSSTNSANFACHIPSMDGTPIKERAMEISSSSSLSSPPSSNISGARGQSAADTNRAPAIPPEDESPYKKSHTESNSCNYPFSHILRIVNSLKDGLHEHDNQLSSSKTATNGVANAERGSKACSGCVDVDLELRLGQNPA